MIKESIMQNGLPEAQGLYSPANEHDNCGIGFVAHIKGQKSHDIVSRGLEVLARMNHRGATGADAKTGDGAGIQIQVPHEFIVKQGIDVPDAGQYGTGLLFLPKVKKEADLCISILKQFCKEEQLELFHVRQVPVDKKAPGEIALRAEPTIVQVFIKSKIKREQDTLERKLYVVRKLSEHEVLNSKLKHKKAFYFPSLSTKTMIYKGMLTPDQVPAYFLDLQNPDLKSAISLVHSRFSTNTFPTWELAQPFRIVAHNGEINTVRGNRLWMHARESLLKSEVFGDDLKKVLPIIEPGKSDSASFDNVLEFLHMAGRPMHHALCMMIPESFNDRNPIPDSLKAFYEYHSTIMEPWDGPASIVFSDGRYIGGTLDRNGLRPSRYILTNDDLMVMGSEVGVQDFDPASIKEKGRLRPGKILLVDTKLGIIIPDQEVKKELTQRNPYQNWIKENRLMLEDIEVQTRVASAMGDDYETYLKEFGYSKEDIRGLIKGMATNGMEPTASMGNDSPLAAFSDKPQRFFNYFKQLFAQVTNPPIDPIREELVMSLTNYIGALNKNILEENPEHAKMIKFRHPIITNTDLGKIKDIKDDYFTHATIPMVFPAKEGEKGFKKALENILAQAEKAVDDEMNFIILSDRFISKEMAALPSLLVTAAVHHHLIQKQKRMQIGIIVETAEAREVMHFALLFGYGASIVNPYLAFATIDDLVKTKEVEGEYGNARKNYIKAVEKGLLKIFSKMGISTLRSYHGAQIFEALGVHPDIAGKYLKGTHSRIGGVGFKELTKEALMFHDKAFAASNEKFQLKNEGVYAYRQDGERHAWNPESIGLLQWSTRTNDYSKFKEYSERANNDNKTHLIRGFLKLKPAKAIDISEVEPIENIMKRFVTGAMSYGSISKEAHEALAVAMNTIGGRSNTGEGGEDPARFGTIKNSKIKQVASGRFGVTNNYLSNAEEIQIKVAQGAKPGEGGQLPGFKVNKIIAKTRNSTPGITLISPPPHHDIYSIEDLAQLIYDLKVTNPAAKVSVKLVAEDGVGTIAAGVSKAFSDVIIIAGYDGGTGASPASSIKHAGLPPELGIAETQQTLVMNDLRRRVKLQVDGQLKTGLDVVKMACLGGEEFGFSTSALIVMGCVMMRKCHLNTCPMGIATQSEELRARFIGKADYVITFFKFLAEEIRECLAEMGYTKMDDIIGRPDLLEVDKSVQNWKSEKIDFDKILFKPKEAELFAIRNVHPNTLNLDDHKDRSLIKDANPAIKSKQKVWIETDIKNTDRTVGAMLSGEVSKRYGEDALPADTINCIFHGSAGQSFGAFAVKGVNLRLQGDANDYLGKGLSGGNITVVPRSKSTFDPAENIIVGNTTLYGATAGNVYIKGVVGERFAVRNSGANTVVEGTGDHCCEYMTGGRVVVLGKTGRNFAAGMSGGIAYVLDVDGDFDYYCNKGLVELSAVEDKADIVELQTMIDEHLTQTRSNLAAKILTNWDEFLPKFVKVIPFEYKKILEEEKLRKIEAELQKSVDDRRHE
ncbi:MAG: glutamate synthase large subunit [Prolixibacteraceae bacterium]|jgi:glutamate synthase (NADPH/NADH) large chain|nr:glutamate synthase large subunit [Prolixibacteraceae bacterium]